MTKVVIYPRDRAVEKMRGATVRVSMVDPAATLDGATPTGPVCGIVPESYGEVKGVPITLTCSRPISGASTLSSIWVSDLGSGL